MNAFSLLVYKTIILLVCLCLLNSGFGEFIAFVLLQTCLSKGGGFHFPPCHMLNVSGFRILVDCPLDLSSLAIFSPIPVAHQVHESLERDSVVRKKQKIEKTLDANDLVHAEPWYKTVKNLHLWDASFIDVVLISSPVGMLGLPFLTRTKDFSAKVTRAWEILGNVSF